jgi:hypothetical protein
MKKWSVLLLVNFILIAAFAQSYEGVVEYQKNDARAIVIEFPYQPSVVEAAMIDKMEKLGFKKRESHGFLTYKESVLSEVSTEPADYMIKVERKSRKDKDESVVYLLVYRKEENIIARNDALINSNARMFMNRLAPDIDSYILEQQIKDQEETVAKAEKKLRNLQDDQGSLEKKLRKVQEDLKDNSLDQVSQQKDLDSQKRLLENLKSKRKV